MFFWFRLHCSHSGTIQYISWFNFFAMPLKQKRKAAGKSKKIKKVDDDTACAGPESSWFDAAANAEQLRQYCNSWTGQRFLEILDVFSFNEGMRHVAGTKVACSLDIRLSPKHDLTSARGVLLLLAMLMSLVHGGLVTLAPPCSLFVWLSCSVHLRHKMGPYGQTKNYKVRLANRIVQNCEPR